MLAKLKELATFILVIGLFSSCADSLDSEEQVTAVEGVVKSENGTPIPGVNVVVEGFNIGSITDLNGHYKVTLPEGASELTYSFIGLESQKIAIGRNGLIDVVMKEDGEIEETSDEPYFEVSKSVVIKDGKRLFTGKVYTKKGKMLKEVAVNIMYANDSKIVMTDEKGEFNIELSDGAMIAYFEKEQYEPNIINLEKLIKEN